MTLSIPELDVELEATLQHIVETRTFDPDTEPEKWSKTILPAIITRLNLISEIASSQGEQFNTRPEGVDLPSAISSTNSRIVRQLQQAFVEHPPFTIVRIAEILLNPKQEGYDLVNNSQILKYFNSLAKIVFVSSSITDFPPTTFSNVNGKVEEPSNEVVEPVITSQTLVNIPLVAIPWLSEAKNVKEETKNGEDTNTKGNSTVELAEGETNTTNPITTGSQLNENEKDEEQNGVKDETKIIQSPESSSKEETNDSHLEDPSAEGQTSINGAYGEAIAAQSQTNNEKETNEPQPSTRRRRSDGNNEGLSDIDTSADIATKRPKTDGSSSSNGSSQGNDDMEITSVTEDEVAMSNTDESAQVDPQIKETSQDIIHSHNEEDKSNDDTIQAHGYNMITTD
ncbi:uncharacterized protein RJT20DRAFT_5415 [Scheffersomyces xylosifermentans]|uniref:uncharacterized protein n=1 Tax=Scheffersomyces xylosifermentans TaxID=1304137 RepID=UPI00315DCC9A